ncbi:sensor histidine kinase [Emticicia agri]|uniref:Histidine kinase n=1 Tax=Emticicia agri TaxID=2492393 RepID=A0A4Q5M342_9BACT|nr:histidine kinase [Emticicia agri]RYU96469.1 histidine kinase [Emticicia agri]
MAIQSFVQRHRNLIVHLAFWCAYFSFFFYQIGFQHSDERNLARLLADAIAHVSVIAIASYMNYFYFLPRFLKHKNSWRYLFEFIIPFFLLHVFLIYLKRQIYIDSGNLNRIKVVYSTSFFIRSFISAMFIVIFVGMLKFVEDWFELEARKKEVENEKLIAELRFLKAQINPHFLFNTLNNLYSLAFSNSPNTTEVIAKLSKMMRYMLYDSNHAKVPLEKEIEYIENYISLEKLRLNHQIPIDFVVKGNTSQVMIVPLVLITFLENAFKHGVSGNDPNSWIKVLLLIDGKICTYTVENSTLIAINGHTKESSGIGLQNLKRRLELSYPDSYELKVENKDNKHRIQLKIDL